MQRSRAKLARPRQSREVLAPLPPDERTNHWIVAIAFVLVALSGLALFHPGLFWLSNLFGGGTWTRILHPLIGLLMAVAFLFLGASVWKDNRMQDRDWKWLRQMQDLSPAFFH